MAVSSGQTYVPEFVDIGGLRTRMLRVGRGFPVLVLHGWGGQIESVNPIISELANTVEVIAVDLPGFGQTDLPAQAWNVGDYAAWTVKLLAELGLTRVSIVGHSFGGRIAIHLAAHTPETVSRLLLVDSAGIRPRRGARYYGKVYSAKAAKHVGPWLGPAGRRLQARVAARAASSDYATAGPLRPTFVRVVNEDLTPLLPHISAPTLLIWGELDDSTPLADARRMEHLIPDAGLVVFDGASHYSYLDQPARFGRIARNFFGTNPT